MHLNTRTLLFKANYRQNPRIGFEIRKKGKYKRAKKFVMKMKKIQKETKVALKNMQEEMKKYTDRKKAEVDEYKVGDLVILSTKDLEISDDWEENRKVNREIYETLQDKENHIIKHSRIRAT